MNRLSFKLSPVSYDLVDGNLMRRLGNICLLLTHSHPFANVTVNWELSYHSPTQKRFVRGKISFKRTSLRTVSSVYGGAGGIRTHQYRGFHQGSTRSTILSAALLRLPKVVGPEGLITPGEWRLGYRFLSSSHNVTVQPY